MVCTRLDIDYAVWIVSKFLSNSKCLYYDEPESLFNNFNDTELGGDLNFEKSTLWYLMLYAWGAIS